jgi:hypothetical protein
MGKRKPFRGETIREAIKALEARRSRPHDPLNEKAREYGGVL